MPLFMDIHEKVEGLTAEAVAGAHKADLETQGAYGVDYKQYWFDEGVWQGVLPGRRPRRRDREPGAPRGARTGRRPADPGAGRPLTARTTWADAGPGADHTDSDEPAAEAGGSRSASRRLVGRDDALDRLEALLDETVGRHRLGTALLEGPAGIGKTRVVERAHQAARSVRGVDVLVGHCVAQGGQTLPYAPLVELLADLVRREGVDDRTPLGRSRRGRAGSPGAGTARPRGEAHARKPRREPAVPGALRAAAASSASAARWCSSSRTCTGPTPRPASCSPCSPDSSAGAVLLLLTLRTDESLTPPGLPRYLAELARRGDQHVRLEPLTREEQARQISDILGLPPRRQLLDEVYARAEGNPFFAEELLALGARRRRAADDHPRPADGPAGSTAAGHPAGPAHREPDRAGRCPTGCSRLSST